MDGTEETLNMSITTTAISIIMFIGRWVLVTDYTLLDLVIDCSMTIAEMALVGSDI